MSADAQTELTTYDDGIFIRTAIVTEEGDSIAIIDKNGNLLALLNIFHNPETGWFAADIIPTEGRWNDVIAMTNNMEEQGRMVRTPTRKLVGIDCRKGQ